MYLKKAMERFGEVEATEKLKEFVVKRGERSGNIAKQKTTVVFFIICCFFFDCDDI